LEKKSLGWGKAHVFSLWNFERKQTMMKKERKQVDESTLEIE
jgi:hypothetical protein